MVIAVGEKTAEGEIEVLEVVSKPVEGVVAGQIDNIEQVSTAIREAVTEIEEKLHLRITEAYAGISGNFVRCARHTDHVFVAEPHNSINQADVEALYARMCNVQAPDNEMIMERIPQNYMIDNNREVTNPVGSFGRRLSSTYNFILCNKTPIQRLDMALKRLGIKLLGVFPNVIASPEAVLQSFDKEEGVAVVDLGGGVTDVAVYYNNALRYVASIPMGASAINRDIYSMGIFKKRIERLKKDYGSAVAELASAEKIIRVSGRTPRESKDIILRNLATVIEARACDIVEFVMLEIKDSGFLNKLGSGIVLTGGSAQLKDIDVLFKRYSDMNVRVALPDTGITESSFDKVEDAAYSTIVGLLIKGAEKGPCAVAERERPAVPPTPQPQPVQQPQQMQQPQPQPFHRPDEMPHTGFTPNHGGFQPQQQPHQPYNGGQPRQGMPQMQPQQPQHQPQAQPFVPPTPSARPAAPAPQPAPQPAPTPAPQPAAPVQEAPRPSEQPFHTEPQPQQPQQPQPQQPHTADTAPEDKKRPKRDWIRLFSDKLKDLDKKFSSVDDEEI